MNLKQVIFWKKHRRKSFINHLFEDVYIDDEQIKESIIDWITRLNYRNIPIEKFSYLFSKYEGIAFPIKISGQPCNLQITDSNGNNYHLQYSQYFNPTEYSIEKMTNWIYKDFTYWLTKNSELLLHKLKIVQFKEKSSEAKNILTFYYNFEPLLTKVELQINLDNSKITLELSYELVDFEHDNKIWKNLLDLPEKSHNKDILLISMKKILESKNS